MDGLVGGTIASFIGLGVVLFGLGAWATGQALALTWRPLWLVVPSVIGLTATQRFLDWGLFGGKPFSISGFLLVSATLLAIGVAAYRLTLTHRMVAQYPWLYERAGLFAWRVRT